MPDPTEAQYEAIIDAILTADLATPGSLAAELDARGLGDLVRVKLPGLLGRWIVREPPHETLCQTAR